MSEFDRRNRTLVAAMADDGGVAARTREWLLATSKYEYSYHFRWLGLPIIQYPQDVLALQEVVWATKPDLIIETGIARGGSLVFYASLLELIGGNGRVIGVDIDIRAANRQAIEDHPMAARIDMVEGSSISPDIVDTIIRLATGRDQVMVVLDSNHTHDHVLRELELYSPLVRPGGYLVVLDTIIEQMPKGSFPGRPWDQGDNPATAVRAFLATNDRFEVDHEIEDKLLITVAPGGYLRCVKE